MTTSTRTGSPKKALIVSAIAGFCFATLGTACAVVWGFEDPLDPAASPALVGDGSAAEGRAPGCENEHVDETVGVFVIGGDAKAEAGAPEDPLCGTKDAPCTHIATGLSRARDLAKTTVYVVRGTYTESLSVPAGITLQGGWNALRTGSTVTYARACADPPGSTVTIQAPDDQATAVLIDDTAAPVTLNDLTIKTKATAAASESLYGVRAHGDKNKPAVTLIDVFVIAANAGAGVPGAAGVSGDAGAGSCEPPFVPNDGGGAVPPIGDAGAAGDAASAAGFGPDGIIVSNGSDGIPGARGDDGESPVAPVPISCFASCTPPALLGACTGNPGTPVSGKAGGSGCGGLGGGAGHGGGGGGSSVALYAWNAAITITRGGLTSANGGAGAIGGTGSLGGAGALGAKGADSAPCITNCGTGIIGTGCSTTSSTSPGTAGTQGGIGGAGGGGSPGAGGDSFAIASGGTSVIMVDPKSTALVFGAPGNAPMGGVPGKAGPEGMP